MPAKVFMYRGVPGSGKTTLITLRHDPVKTIVCSADHFFLGDSGYVFDWRKLPDAHAACMKKFSRSLDMYVDSEEEMDIVVDNTNIDVPHMLPYVSLAKERGCAIKIITILCDPKTAAGRNVHGVGLKSIEKKHEHLVSQSIPDDWGSHEVMVVVDDVPRSPLE